MSNAKIPNYEDLVAATLEGLLDEQRGGSASNQEIVEAVADLLNLSDETLEIPHGKGPRSEFLYRAGWARTFLRHMEAVENSGRGVWTVTDKGRSLAASKEAVRESYRETRRRLEKDWRSKTESTHANHEPGSTAETEGLNTAPEGEPIGDEWKDTLLSVLRGMPPDRFEHLCRLILLKSGFTKVKVTGGSGDRGIDGVGVLRIELISFQIVFQCKRYAGSVGAGAIREFRGSFMGRADKGLFLTTGHFTREAQREALGDRAAAIDLIDGDNLCDLLKKLDLGVRTKMVEEVTVNPEFFESF